MICPYCENEILGKAASAHKLHCKDKPQELKYIAKMYDVSKKSIYKRCTLYNLSRSTP